MKFEDVFKILNDHIHKYPLDFQALEEDNKKCIMRNNGMKFTFENNSFNLSGDNYDITITKDECQNSYDIFVDQFGVLFSSVKNSNWAYTKIRALSRKINKINNINNLDTI